MSKHTKRWYDKYPKFSHNLEKIKKLPKQEQKKIFDLIKYTSETMAPNLLERNIAIFPLKRRWYDKDPYSWLIVNSLHYAKIDLINEITNLLEEYFNTKITQP